MVIHKCLLPSGYVWFVAVLDGLMGGGNHPFEAEARLLARIEEVERLRD